VTRLTVSLAVDRARDLAVTDSLLKDLLLLTVDRSKPEGRQKCRPSLLHAQNITAM